MTRDSLSQVPVQPGDVLAGKYRVERVLGAGGMGVVVQATHLELEERVAVKFLLPEAVESPEAAARFVREARAAVKIKSEHVARVIDVGRLENGAPYMVMEFLEGSDLSALVERGPLSVEDAVDYLIQACDAMVEAHGHGIVHRDLKPSNLFLTTRADGSGLVKVLDFGISKVNVPDVADAALTKTSTLMGSPYYMSPEQMRSAKNVDHRTDVWALGVILYELLAGTPPFTGDSLPALLSAIITEPPAPIRARRADVPAELEGVLLRTLQKDRAQRYQSVGELAAALLPFAPRRSRYMLERIFRISGVTSAMPNSLPPSALAPALAPSDGVATRRVNEPHAPGPAAAAMTNASWAGTNPAGNKGKALALGAGLGLGFLLVAGITAFALLGRGGSSAAAPPLVATTPAPSEPAKQVDRAPEVRVTPTAVASALAATSREPAAATSSAPSAGVNVAPVAKPDGASRAPRPARKPEAKPRAPAAPPAPAPTRKNPLAIDLK